MSRFLILSENGDGLGLATRLQDEGHSVKLWVRESDYKDSGKGIVDITSCYEFGQDVIADCSGFGPILDLLRDQEVSTFAGSCFADKLESDRKFSDEVMSEAGIDTPLSKRATSWEEAAKLVEEMSKKSDDGKVAIKPEGDLSGSFPSYVAKDVEDAMSMLKSFERKTGDKPELTVQQFVKGVALSTEGWFNGTEWIEGMFNHTIERKQSLNDDLGPSVGCAGNVVWRCDKDDPVVKETLTKLTVLLRKHHYVGPIDINCVVNSEGVYGLEFTPRFGYDAFPTILYTLCSFDFGSFSSRCSRGDVCSDVALLEGFGAGVRLRPPQSMKEQEDFPELRGLEEKDMKWFYPYCVQKTEEETLQMTKGESGPGVINGYGDTIKEAFAKAYKLCSKVQLRGVQYRTDLGEVILKDFKQLQKIVDRELVEA